jgi:hypothetical protein
MRLQSGAGAPVSAPALVPVAGAPVGRADATRRWCLADRDGAPRFAGVTRPEGEAAARWLADVPGEEWNGLLVPVALPVVLSGGAGPYLLDASGRLVLVVAEHPAIPGVRVAMGPAEPHHPIGLVSPRAEGGWRWLARAEVTPAGRLAALDELDGLGDEDGARRWAARWGGLA